MTEEQANSICLALQRGTLWESYRTLFWSDFDLTIYEMENRKSVCSIHRTKTFVETSSGWICIARWARSISPSPKGKTTTSHAVSSPFSLCNHIWECTIGNCGPRCWHWTFTILLTRKMMSVGQEKDWRQQFFTKEPSIRPGSCIDDSRSDFVRNERNIEVFRAEIQGLAPFATSMIRRLFTSLKKVKTVCRKWRRSLPFLRRV